MRTFSLGCGLDLGRPAEVFRAFSEIQRALPEGHEAHYGALLSVPHLDPDEMDAARLSLVRAQAAQFAREHLEAVDYAPARRILETLIAADGHEGAVLREVVVAGNPWRIERDGDKWLVVKADDGKVVGTHDSLKEAKAQLAALHANVKHAVPNDFVEDETKAVETERPIPAPAPVHAPLSEVADDGGVAFREHLATFVGVVGDIMGDIVGTLRPKVVVNVPPPIVNVEVQQAEPVYQKQLPPVVNVNVPAPIVNVSVPEAPAPVITLPEPRVTVNVQPRVEVEPQITVVPLPAPRKPRALEVERDRDGNVTRVVDATVES